MTSRSTISVTTLILVNLLPLFGVLFLDWSLFTVLLLYWIESGVIGFINLFKIALARAPFSDGFRINGQPPGPNAKFAMLFFFPVHYGVFWVVHGVFLFVLFGSGFLPGVESGTFDGLSSVNPRGVAFAAAGLAISHTVSFFMNFVGGQEYLTMSPDRQMFQPYSRVIVLHVVVLTGGWAIGSLGTPLAAVALLVILKLIVDVNAHLREHRRETSSQTPPVTSPSSS